MQFCNELNQNVSSSSHNASSRVDMSDSKLAEKKDCTNEFYDSGVISETCENIIYSESDIKNESSVSDINVSMTDSITDKETKEDAYKDSGIDVMKSTTDMNTDSGFISEFNIPWPTKNSDSEKAKPVEIVEPVNVFPSDELYAQNRDGDTILHLAIICRREDAIKYLVFRASESDMLDTRNNNGQTCLHLSVLTNQPRITRFLLLAGANPCIADLRGNTPLHLACDLKHSKCVDALIDLVGNCDKNYYRFRYVPEISSVASYINEINYDGLSSLHIATNRKHLSVLRKLMERGADINAKELKAGQSVLHEAVMNGSIDLVELILQHRSLNIEQENYACHTAYQLSWSHPRISKLLLDKKALELDFVEYEVEDAEILDGCDPDEEFALLTRNGAALNDFNNTRSQMVV